MSNTAWPTIVEVKDEAGTAMTYMARIVGSGNTAYQQADLSSITVQVWDENETQTLGVTALTIADVIFDILQTTSLDAEWTEDTTGYNFKYTVPATAFQTVKRHAVEFVFTPVTGAATVIVAHKITRAINSTLPL